MTVYHMEMVLPFMTHCEDETVTVPSLNCNTVFKYLTSKVS